MVRKFVNPSASYLRGPEVPVLLLLLECCAHQAPSDTLCAVYCSAWQRRGQLRCDTISQ
jgi:hypothetical protein